MQNFLKRLHLWGTWRRLCTFGVNRIFPGTRCFRIKRLLLQAAGHRIGRNTRVVGPLHCTGTLIVGEDCWLGKNLQIDGNGVVRVGDRCDIAPEVLFSTGGHKLGAASRRAGTGETHTITVGDGCWLCTRVTVVNSVHIGSGSVVAACACVTGDVPENTLVGGVPAKELKGLYEPLD